MLVNGDSFKVCSKSSESGVYSLFCALRITLSLHFSITPNIMEFVFCFRYKLKICLRQIFKLLQKFITAEHDEQRWNHISSDMLQVSMEVVAPTYFSSQNSLNNPELEPN